jgi:hypothetical protein
MYLCVRGHVNVFVCQGSCTCICVLGGIEVASVSMIFQLDFRSLPTV